MYITITNDFHKTRRKVRVPENGSSRLLGRRAIRDIRRDLCGIAGCTCGDSLGAHGPQQGYQWMYQATDLIAIAFEPAGGD